MNCIAQSDFKLTEITIYDVTVNSLVDTGANCSIIRESIARRLDCTMKSSSVRLDGIGSGQLYTFAMITVPVRFEDICIELDLHVVSDDDFPYEC